MTTAEQFTSATAPSAAAPSSPGSSLSSFFSGFSPAFAARLEAAKVAPRATAAPWTDFFPLQSVHAFAVPASRYLFPRIKSNISRYAGNYAFVCVPLLALFSLSSFLLFFFFVLFCVIWGYVAWYSEKPITVAGTTITIRQLTLALVSLDIILEMCLLSTNKFVILCVLIVLCLVHATFRVSQEETIDFSRPN